MHTQKIIEQFGYKPNEAKVYLSLFELGECTVADIARQTNLPRTSILFILNKLHLDGLINFYTKKRSKYWTAEKPEKFLMQLKEKEVAFESILSQLHTIQHGEEKKPAVSIFSGIEELKLIFQDILETKHNICAILPWDSWIKTFGEEYVDDFIELQVKHFLKLRLLTSKTKDAIELKKYDARELRYTSFLLDRCAVTSAILIYGNKVAIVSLHDKYPTGFLIDDEKIKNTMLALFEELWDKNTE